MAIKLAWVLDSCDESLTGLAKLFVTAFYRMCECNNNSFDHLDAERLEMLLDPDESRESFEESLKDVSRWCGDAGSATPEEAVAAWKQYVREHGLDPDKHTVILLVWW